MRTSNKTIEEVVKHNLCTGCGTCVALCPNSAIRIVQNKDRYIPEVDNDKCNHCGICYEACPGDIVNFKQLEYEIFGKRPRNSLIGNYEASYVGTSTNMDIRYNSSSGGLASSLLIFALEEKIIDGALVTKMSDSNPLEPEVFIARNKKEIISASRSKYCPVPVNEAIKDIIKEKGKFAIVGLPCHIHGIRKAENVNTKLKKKIILNFGLMCHHTPTFYATEFLLKKIKVDKKNIRKINYRGHGWPGGMTIILKDGKVKFIPLFSPLYQGGIFHNCFISKRCSLCIDKSNKLADISFADPYALSDDSIGESLIVSRNIIGENLLKKALSKKKITLRKISKNEVLDSTALLAHQKLVHATTTIFKNLSKEVPFFNQKLPKIELEDYINAFLVYIQTFFSSKKSLMFLADPYIILLRITNFIQTKFSSNN